MADPAHHQDASATADPSGIAEFRIFLSYRREDASGHAGRLFDFLCQGGAGGDGPGFRKEQIFMDIDTMAPGVDFRRVIEEAVGSCDVFIAVIGKQWVTAVDADRKRRLTNAQDFVRLEIESALERDIPVVPALVQGAQMPNVDELPETFRAFAGRNAVELSDLRWSHDVGKLIAWLKTEEEKKAGRAQAEREQADLAERERAAEEEWVAAEQAERRERARLERKQAEQVEQERGDADDLGVPERRRFGRKHIIVAAALLVYAIAGIAGALFLISGSGESEPTEALPTTQPTPTQPAPTTQSEPEDEPSPTPGDADGDGLADAEDPFALDAGNGSTFPVSLKFTAPVADTIKGSGFTGLMTGGKSYDALFDAGNIMVGGGTFRVSKVEPGAAAGPSNEQRNAFQFGIPVPDESFTAHARLIEPFADGAPIGEEVMGLFVGTGDQDNYVRLGVGGGVSEGVKFRVEVDGAGKGRPEYRPLALPGPEAVDLYLTIDPTDNRIQAAVTKTENGETSQVATFRRSSIPADWIHSSEPLAVGIISSRGDDGPPFAATWELIEACAGRVADYLSPPRSLC